MKIQLGETYVKLWLSARDTKDWANRPGKRWPSSQLSGNRIFAEFDRNGLCDLEINGSSMDIDANELSACCADHLIRNRRFKRPYGWNSPGGIHPCFDVACGQFLKAS